MDSSSIATYPCHKVVNQGTDDNHRHEPGQKSLAVLGLSTFNLHLKPGMSHHVLFDQVLRFLQTDTSFSPDNLNGFDLVALEQRCFRGSRKWGGLSFT